MSRSPARSSRVSAIWRSNGLSATRSFGITCSFSSIRDSDIRSSTSRAMREACPCMIARNLSRASASSRAGPRNVSMKPIKVASGVRSSWLALAMKSARICSARFNSVMSCRVNTATAPSGDGWSMRAKRARSWRSTGTVREKSITRALSPRNTASAAASTAGLRNPAARSRGSGVTPMNAAACALARTIRRRFVEQDQRVRHRCDDRLRGRQLLVGDPDAFAPEPGEPGDREPDLARQRSEPASHLPCDNFGILVRAEAVDRVADHGQVGYRTADDKHRRDP